MRRLIAVAFLALAPGASVAQENFFNSNGVQIHYLQKGIGEPIVLIHGQGVSSQMWVDAGVLQNLATNYRVIAMDVRGHGMSGKPHDPKQYGREMALDVVRLLDHLGIQRAHIVGYSMGAQLTSLLLTLHPERFLTATLGGGTGRFKWTDRDAQIAEQEATEYERYGISPTLTREIAPPNSPPQSDAAIKRESEAALANPNQDRFAIAALTRSRHEQTITAAQVAAVKVPTLGVVGALDPARADFQDLKKVRPTLKLVVIEGATHGGDDAAFRSPDFVAAIREFIASNRLR